MLLFFDTSKNNARRWCDMAVCGPWREVGSRTTASGIVNRCTPA